MHISNRMAYANVMQLLMDVVFLGLTFIFSYKIASYMTNMHALGDYSWILIVFIPAWISSMAFFGMYNKTTFHYYDRVFLNILYSTIYSGMILIALLYFIKEQGISRIFLLTFLTSGVLISFSQRSINRVVFNKINPKNHDAKRVLIVGSPETARKFNYYIKKTNIKYSVLGYVQVGETPPVRGRFNLGCLENLKEILIKNVVDEVVFALPKDYVGEVERYVQLCEEMGLTVQVLVNLYDLKISKLNIAMLGTLPMLTFHTVSLNPIQNVVKRVIDVFGALVGILLLACFSIFIVPAIKMDSSGPVFFKQTRVGRCGRKFNIYKFRTMYTDAEERKKSLMHLNECGDGRIFKIKDDPRITPIGKFLRNTSLDELPQFINVLKGEMSLVGTRPPTVDEVDRYEVNHWRRISIKPGITGMWQVSGRSSITDFEHIVTLDTQYIDNWSVWMDISILFKTVVQVLQKKEAY